ncbi:MAG: tetratricopeptide repeat protein, partial [Myxococcota bacterium]
ANLDHALRSNRLVVLIGPGGYGKTRLASEVAHRGFPAAAFVSLIGCTSASEARIRVARAIGAESTGDALRRVLHRVPLLILDNAEEMASQLGDVVLDWARSCAELRILVTSRQVLGCAGERVVNLGPLDEADALELLDQRVSISEPDPIRRQLVAALGCVPLAVELGAARLVTLHVQTLLDLLPGDLDVLSAPRAGIPQRHTSMEANVHWSWSLLSPSGREALELLQVFAGAFDLEAANHVVGALALDAITELAEASLLRKRSDGRWAFESAVRSFARNQPSTHGAVALSRWADWLCTQAEVATHPSNVACRQPTLRRIEPELLQARNSSSAALRSRANLALALLWRDAGPMGEALDAAEESVKAARETDDTVLLDRTLAEWTFLSHLLLPASEAMKAAETFRALVSDAFEHAALITHAGTVRDIGRPEEALALLEHGAGAARAAADTHWLGVAELESARCMWNLKRFEQANRTVDQAVNSLMSAGALGRLPFARKLQVVLAARVRDFARTRSSADLCLRDATTLGTPRSEAWAHEALAVSLRIEGKWASAAEHLQRTAQIWRRLGNQVHEASALTRLGLCFFPLGRVEQALRHLKTATELAEKEPYILARSSYQLAAMQLASGHVAEAVQNAGYSVQIHPSALLREEARVVWAAALAESGDHDRAQEELARIPAASPDEPNVVLCAQLGRAHVAIARGEPNAMELATQALTAASQTAFDGRANREHYISVNMATTALERLVNSKQVGATARTVVYT